MDDWLIPAVMRILIPKNLASLLVVLCLSCLSGCDREFRDIREKITPGQSMQEIMNILGQPDAKKMRVKSNRFIWGPEEDFWHQIPMKSRLEVWSYRFSDGHLNLYFINGNKNLDFIAFAPEGVVY